MDDPTRNMWIKDRLYRLWLRGMVRVITDRRLLRRYRRARREQAVRARIIADNDPSRDRPNQRRRERKEWRFRND